MRLPVAEAFCEQVALDLALRGEREAAAAVMLQLDTYVRPSEAVNLTMGQLLPPSPAMGPSFARTRGI
eukprot:5621503-Lingulodinium_polyedra.AAC.1